MKIISPISYNYSNILNLIHKLYSCRFFEDIDYDTLFYIEKKYKIIIQTDNSIENFENLDKLKIKELYMDLFKLYKRKIDYL